jgi:hypothetical protein
VFAQSAAESRLATRSAEYQIDLSISPPPLAAAFLRLLRLASARLL